MTLLASGSPPVTGSCASPPADVARVRRALTRLHSRHWRDREEALKRLAEAGARAELIAPSLRDRFPEVRIAAIVALGRTTEGELTVVTHHLLSAIDDPDARVVAEAIRTLTFLRVEQARPEIIAVLDGWCRAAAARPADRHPFCVARAAVAFLAELGPPEAAEHFLPLLGLPWREIRGLGRWGIGCLRYTPAAPALIGAVERLAGLESRSHADAEEARSSIRVLRRLQAHEAVPVLLRVAREAVGLRSAAVEALTRIDPERAAAELVDMLADPGARLRRALLRLMAKGAPAATLPRIRPMLADSRHLVRSAALKVVARLKDLGSTEEVRRLCAGDPSPDVRSVAVEALVTILGEGAIPMLESLAEDTNANIQKSARRHLERLRPGATGLTATAGQDDSPGDDGWQDAGEQREDRLLQPGESYAGCDPAMSLGFGLRPAGASARARMAPGDVTTSFERIG
jgi:HEAT repeat protein